MAAGSGAKLKGICSSLGMNSEIFFGEVIKGHKKLLHSQLFMLQ